MDVDNRARKIYLPTAEFEEAKPGERPKAKPGTFMIVVVGPKQPTPSVVTILCNAQIDQRNTVFTPRALAVV
jgi:hypothetical protein